MHPRKSGVLGRKFEDNRQCWLNQPSGNRRPVQVELPCDSQRKWQHELLYKLNTLQPVVLISSRQVGQIPRPLGVVWISFDPAEVETRVRIAEGPPTQDVARSAASFSSRFATGAWCLATCRMKYSSEAYISSWTRTRGESESNSTRLKTSS